MTARWPGTRRRFGAGPRLCDFEIPRNRTAAQPHERHLISGPRRPGGTRAQADAADIRLPAGKVQSIQEKGVDGQGIALNENLVFRKCHGILFDVGSVRVAHSPVLQLTDIRIATGARGPAKEDRAFTEELRGDGTELRRRRSGEDTESL